MKKTKARMFTAVFLLAAAGPLAAATGTEEAERDKRIDAALHYYYNGETEEAKKIALSLKETFPEDPFFNELMAEVLWQELERRVAPDQQKYRRVDYRRVKENQYIVEQFHKEIFEGLVLTQSALERNPADSKYLFLRGMLLVRQGGFIVKFESGLRSYSESDEKTAEGLRLIQKSIELDPALCAAKYVLALGKYSIIRGASESVFYKLMIMLRSKAYAALGSNFNFHEVLAWLREAMRCQCDYYFAKDTEIDKKFIYQDILISRAGKYDKEALPVLEELHSRFPKNKTIRNNLFLARLHIQNKK
jgi:hypothetical protein